MLKAKQRPFMNMNKGEHILPFEKMKEQRMRERMERAQRAMELRRYCSQHNPVNEYLNAFLIKKRSHLKASRNCWTRAAWTRPYYAGAWRTGKPAAGETKAWDGETESGKGASGEGEDWTRASSYRAGAVDH